MKLLFIVSLLSLVPMSTFASEHPLQIQEENEVTLGDEVGTEATYRYNFGQVRVNRSESTTFTLRNRNSYPIYINDIDLDGDDAFRKNDNCPRILLRNQSCQVRVTFRPRDTGRYEGELEINLTGASDIDVELRGRGVRRGGGIDF